MNPENIGAFFDFDETLLDTESSRLGFRYLRQRRLVSLGFILKVLAANIFYKRHWLSDEKMAMILIKFYRNRHLEDFQQGAVAFYQDHLKLHLAPNIHARVNKHRRQGHRLILISGSVRYMLEPVAEDLGFDHLLCTDLEIGGDGLLTGCAKAPSASTVTNVYWPKCWPARRILILHHLTHMAIISRIYRCWN